MAVNHWVVGSSPTLGVCTPLNNKIAFKNLRIIFMPITKSAKKALSRSEVLRERNSEFKSGMKNTMKLVKKAIDSGKTENITDLAQTAYSSIDKAERRNIIHKNNAARKKSQIARMVSSTK